MKEFKNYIKSNFYQFTILRGVTQQTLISINLTRINSKYFKFFATSGYIEVDVTFVISNRTHIVWVWFQ